MRIKRLAFAIALAPLVAGAITATKEYVDRKDAEVSAAGSNLVAVAVAPLATTNNLAEAVATRAPAQVAHTFVDGTNAQLRVIRSDAQLIIRAVESANGRRQYRLIEIR